MLFVIASLVNAASARIGFKVSECSSTDSRGGTKARRPLRSHFPIKLAGGSWNNFTPVGRCFSASLFIKRSFHTVQRSPLLAVSLWALFRIV